MKKLQLPIALLLVLSFLLSACQAATTVAPTAAPAATNTAVPPTATAVPPTETAVPPTDTPVPPTETPLPPPDFEALFTELAASLTGDNGYGSISAAKLNEALVENPPFLLDVREASEYEEGHIEGAVNIPVRNVLENLDKLPGLDEPMVVYCGSGHRGALAMAALRVLGYTDVKNLGGGTGAWKKAELPLVMGAPEAPAAISTPIVADQALYEALNAFFTGMPEGFYATNASKLSEALADNPPMLIDVRSTGEWDSQGYIEGAVNIPFNDFFAKQDLWPAKDAHIVIYCGSGHRGAILQLAMYMLGYENVLNLGGGLGAWKAAGLPVAGWVDWPVVWSDFVSNIPAGYYSIKAADLNTAMVENPPFLLDVREPSEVEAGYIAGAVNIPVRDLLKNLDKLPGLNDPIVIYCGSGHRGALAMSALRILGYTDVKNLGGGTGAWKKAELPLETGMPAAPEAGTAPEVDPTRLRDLDAYLSGLPEGFNTVKAADLNTELAEATPPVLVDVRTPDEWAEGIIAGAIKVELQKVPAELLAQLPAKDAAIVIYCGSGHRGAIVAMYLNMLGYTNVRNLNGGLGAWIAAELPVEK
jgi:rhodanese-related sulfurtransferase